MWSFFQGPEIHPDAKTIKQYYEDLEVAIQSVRNDVPHADSDAAFKHAADVLTKVIETCKETESMSALEARDADEMRKTLLRTLGPDGVMEVTGEASYLLAKKYSGLLSDIMNKVYWPVASCPTLFGRSFLTEYGKHFESRLDSMQRKIDLLELRIEQYKPSLHAVSGM